MINVVRTHIIGNKFDSLSYITTVQTRLYPIHTTWSNNNEINNNMNLNILLWHYSFQNNPFFLIFFSFPSVVLKNKLIIFINNFVLI